MNRKDIYRTKEGYVSPVKDRKFDERADKIRLRRSSIKGLRYVRHVLKRAQ